MDIILKKDLSTLTTINETIFSKLENKIEWCINDAVESSILNRDTNTNIDLGFGTLTIVVGDSIKYKFTPSQSLEKSLTNTIINEGNDLKLNLENSLVSKLQNVYKNFF